MTHDTSVFQLDSARTERAEELVAPALKFLEGQNYPLGIALVEHSWRGGPASPVIEALAAYQNEDGGFGKRLEVDIASPVSNPFATRLAMHTLLSLREVPPGPLVDKLSQWLRQAQDEDGDWHFTQEVYDAPLAPWFAGWTFPALNPACCVAGLATRLGIATPEMQARVTNLFQRLATREEARTGAFYNLLPYIEFVPTADLKDRDVWLNAMADSIVETATRGDYDDASHFFDHALGGGSEVIRRLPGEMITSFVDSLMGEQDADGGWPTPYDPAWRPPQTTAALVTLARLRDGV